MRNSVRALLRGWYKTRLKSAGVLKYGHKVSISRGCTFEGGNAVDDRVMLRNTHLGYGSFIGSDCTIVNAKVGRFCSIGDRVNTVIGNHPTKDFISTHPAFYSLGRQAGFTFAEEQLFEDEIYVDKSPMISIEIGNDVWLASGVSIVNGVTIGDGAIVAAGAMVVSDLEPYGIYGGVPAKLIRYRFDEKERAAIVASKWWDKDIEYLRQHAQAFSSFEQFSKLLTDKD